MNFSKKFHSPYNQYRDRNGQSFEVLEPIMNDQKDVEVGSMYKIKFQDGVEIDAWPEEIIEK